MSEARETLVEDRTRAHADHVGHGFDRVTTAAVGVLKAIHAGNRYVLPVLPICAKKVISKEIILTF